MERSRFIWDDAINGLVLSGAAKDDNNEKKINKKKKSKVTKGKIYFPHKHLFFNFKEIPSFTEQAKFQKHYERRRASNESDTGVVDVVLLQDLKNLALYLIGPESLGRELIRFLHLSSVDRFLRALILYTQGYLTTWTELADKRAESKRRAPNPLAGGARLRRSYEMRALRCLLAREYADLLMGCQPEARRYHHARAGEVAFAQSNGERDLRVYETLLQFGHRVAWIALERKHKELIEVELYRLFKTDAFNLAKKKYMEEGLECQVPEDESWILYGPDMQARSKILSNSPLPLEILNTDSDYRLLSIGLTNVKSKDPRVNYLENALLAREEDLPRLGIKVGILGLPRSDFDSMLISQASQEDRLIVDDEKPTDNDEKADDYETMMPAFGQDAELSEPFPMTKLSPRHAGDDEIRESSRKMWLAQSSSY